MASTSASPRARNAAPMPPGPIASHGISPRPRPTGVSIPTKSPARFPRPAAELQPCRLQRIRRHYLPALRRRRSGIEASSATPAPRKRRDAAPRSGYVKPRLAAPLGIRSLRGIASQWPDMPETLILLSPDGSLACAALLGVAALSVDARAQMNPGPPPSAGRAAVNPMCPRLEAQLATIDRGRRRRPGQGRADPPLSGCRRPSSRASSTASPRRPSAWAATVPDSSRCSTASRRNAVRSTTRSSRCGPISTRSPPASSGCAAAASAAPTATISAARC